MTTEDQIEERNGAIFSLAQLLVAGGLATPEEVAAIYRGPGPVVYDVGEERWQRLTELYAPHRKAPIQIVMSKQEPEVRVVPVWGPGGVYR